MAVESGIQISQSKRDNIWMHSYTDIWILYLHVNQCQYFPYGYLSFPPFCRLVPADNNKVRYVQQLGQDTRELWYY